MKSRLSRREFLAATAAATSATAAPSRGVSLIVDPGISHWAIGELESALVAHDAPVQRCDNVRQAQPGNVRILIAEHQSKAARDVQQGSRVALPNVPEALALVPSSVALLATGADSRGLGYAVLELADRVNNSSDPIAALTVDKSIVEQPANEIRSVTRMFCSDVEDKPWYNDREMWPRYFTMLANGRFNRFHLALGIGYDFIRQVTDAYFLFSYPFLLDVPGYQVRVPQLPNSERDNNLAMLKFISEQAVAHGIDFQLGLWMHGYQWIDSPKANYTVEGITRENHGPYCRDAVRLLLKTCPAISGVTFRVHGESGVEEGSYDFWRTVFDGVSTCGRRVDLDMHSKGMDQTMLDMAVATKLPLRLSPKYWAEHMGLPYHQADIRSEEKPRKDATGLMRFSTGSRNFLRYGYGDLLRENRQWKVIHRIWPGTQRLLLWGDPQSAAAYSRAFGFCGSSGVDICEPLSFKGRRGSGIAGDRCAYADATLRPRWDWEKYVYGHRVWGRLLYNPDADPDAWQRYLRKSFGAGAPSVESALANASRILPLVTTAHLPSAANNNYWPEIYTNQSLVDASHPGPYSDTPAPKVFGNVSPLDPQLFSRMNDFADALLAGDADAKYSPIEVAQWLDGWAAAAQAGLTEANKTAAYADGPEYRRFAIDIAIQIGMGRFFAAKFQSGVLYRTFEKTGDRKALEQCLAWYRKARSAFAETAARATGVYLSDITVGELPQLRGHWSDRLPAIDRDIDLLAAKLADAKLADAKPPSDSKVTTAVRVPLSASHKPADAFTANRPLPVELSVREKTKSVRLWYRHVDQAERYESTEMTASGNSFRAVIPSDYTNTQYPIEYYFEVRTAGGKAGLYPGFLPNRPGQPYFVVRRA